MTEIIIKDIDDFSKIFSLLESMPMTRKFGKGAVARTMSQGGAKPSAIYIRVSSAQQAVDGKDSLAEQFRKTWNAVEQRGGIVTSVYVDVCSAANRDRKAFRILLDDLKAGKFVVLGCWHSSRLVRTNLAAGEIEEAIEHIPQSLELFSVSDALDLDVLGMLAWAGRWERKAATENMLMGRQSGVSKGKTAHSTPPFWIQRFHNKQSRIIEYSLKPVAEWIQWAAEAYANGMGSTEIVKYLNEQAVPRATGQTKYGWTRPYLAQILKYSALYGKWGPFWGNYIDVPPLIDKETFDRIQSKISENASTARKTAEHFVALRGILWCGECGQKMGTHARDWDYTYHIQSDGTKKRYRVQHGKLKVKYVCGGQQQFGLKCRKPEYVRDAILFPLVWEKLLVILRKPEFLSYVEQCLRGMENSQEEVELNRINMRLEKLQQREISFAEQRVEGVLSKETHAELMLRIKSEFDELTEAYKETKNKLQAILEVKNQVTVAQDLLEILTKKLDVIERHDQEQLIMALIKRIDVYANMKIEITLRIGTDSIAM